MRPAVKRMSAAESTRVSETVKRRHKFTVLVTTEERQTLERMADELGLTSSDLVRLFIRGKLPLRAA